VSLRRKHGLLTLVFSVSLCAPMFWGNTQALHEQAPTDSPMNPPSAALSRSSKRTWNGPGFRPESRPSALLVDNHLSAFGKGTMLPREVSDYETASPRMQLPLPTSVIPTPRHR
jgi:hypothetical protein